MRNDLLRRALAFIEKDRVKHTRVDRSLYCVSCMNEPKIIGHRRDCSLATLISDLEDAIDTDQPSIIEYVEEAPRRVADNDRR